MEMRTLVVECEVAADKSATTPVRLRVISAQRKDDAKNCSRTQGDSKTFTKRESENLAACYRHGLTSSAVASKPAASALPRMY